MNRSEMIQRALRKMGAVEVSGTLSTATTTSCTDSALANKYSANKFKNYELFITRSTDGNAPQGEHVTVTGSARATGAFSFTDAFTVAPVGDSYSAFKMPLSIEVLVNLTEDALDYFGKNFVREDTSLTTAANTLQYTLPLAVKGATPHDVFLRDSDNIEYDTPTWDIIQKAGGTQNVLAFHRQPSESKTIVIRYLVEHGYLSADSDIVDETIPDPLAVQSLVYHAFNNIQRPRNRQRDVMNTSDAQKELALLENKLSIEVPSRNAQSLNIGRYN